MTKRRGAFRKSALGLGALSLVIVAGAPAREVNREADVRSQIAAANLEDAIVVDCQLPGKLQKLGGMNTYLTPGKLVRLAAVDCRARGGEYTLGDLSSGTLSLQRWKPLAEKGDAEAQYYVARIYANGMGGAPTDYGLAANWYQKAADQNYKSAQQELGYMYEQGLGVERNQMLALNLQRKASGLGEELDYASKVVDAQAQVAALSEQLDASNTELQSLRGELATATDALLKTRSRVARSERAVADLRAELKVAKETNGDPAQLKRLQASLTEKEQALTAARGEMAQLSKQVSDQETTLKNQLADSQRSSAQLNELLANEQEKNRSMAAKVQLAEQRLISSQKELSDLRVQYRAEVDQMAEQREEIERATAKTKDAGAALVAARELELERQLARQQERVAVLEKALAEALRTQTNAASAKSASAREQDQMRQDLAASQKQLEAQRAELTALRSKATQDRQALAKEMSDQMAKQATDLEAKQRRVAALTAETDALRREVTGLRQQSAKDAASDASEAAQTRQTLARAQASVVDMQEKLDRAQLEQANAKRELVVARDELTRQKQLAAKSKAGEMQATLLQRDLDQRNKDLASKDGEIERLKKGLAEQTKLAQDMQAQARRSGLLASNTGGGSTVTKLRSVNSGVRLTAIDNLGLTRGKYRALIIANSKYSKLEKLDTPTADADELAQVLSERYDFDEVKLMKDATTADIMKALHEETTRGSERDSLLIYYAGHGDIKVGNPKAGVPTRAYWLGTDADPVTRDRYIEVDNVRAKIKDMKAKHVLLIVDSCFSGAITTPKTMTVSRSLSDTRLKVQWNRKARMVLTSGGEKPVADGITADPSHSPFARNVLRILRQNEELLSGENLSYQIMDGMSDEKVMVKGDDGKVMPQQPTYSMLQDAGHDVGDFFFVPVANVPTKLADALN